MGQRLPSKDFHGCPSSSSECAIEIEVAQLRTCYLGDNESAMHSVRRVVALEGKPKINGFLRNSIFA